MIIYIYIYIYIKQISFPNVSTFHSTCRAKIYQNVSGWNEYNALF